MVISQTRSRFSGFFRAIPNNPLPAKREGSCWSGSAQDQERMVGDAAHEGAEAPVQIDVVGDENASRSQSAPSSIQLNAGVVFQTNYL
jgi:hypothetical protein